MESVIFLTCNKLLHLEIGLRFCSLHNAGIQIHKALGVRRHGGHHTLTVGALVSLVATGRVTKVY